MDDKTEKLLVRMLYLALISISVLVLLWNPSDPWALLLLTGSLCLSFTFRLAILGGSRNGAVLPVLLVILEIGLTFLIAWLDHTGIALWLYFVLVADAAFYKNNWTISLTTAASFVFQSFNLYIRNTSAINLQFAERLAVNAVIIAVLFGAVKLLKAQSEQKQRLSETMGALKVKSHQLQNAYLKLKETSEELEEMTIVQERNRIAREIHDTVGHTLTTVLLELEAAERLIPVDPSLSAEKLSIAKGQVRKGLADIRESVHTLKSGHEMMSLEQSLRLLIEETQKSGAIAIRSRLEPISRLTRDQEKMLYRALQEGLTNGIRHGKSTAFVFQLYEEKGYVKFLLSDNGQGTAKLQQGFGLTSMEERVKALGGTLTIETAPGEGLALAISIPVAEVEPKEEQMP
ncbi:MAG: sensor histidine kinase [Clostridia bacterium]|nr:sensor histidine kinase [Clostridia bacterium]